MEILKINQWQEILSHLFNNKSISISNLNRLLNGSYSHTARLIFEFEQIQLIIREKKGREIMVSLTDEGLKFAWVCDELIKIKKIIEVKKDENI